MYLAHTHAHVLGNKVKTKQKKNFMDVIAFDFNMIGVFVRHWYIIQLNWNEDDKQEKNGKFDPLNCLKIRFLWTKNGNIKSKIWMKVFRVSTFFYLTKMGATSKTPLLPRTKKTSNNEEKMIKKKYVNCISFHNLLEANKNGFEFLFGWAFAWAISFNFMKIEKVSIKVACVLNVDLNLIEC